MKTILTILMLGTSFLIHSQNISCQELFEAVTSDYDYKDDASIVMSSMLADATYYEFANIGFVVAYIKKSDYDFSGTPYIFCGITRSRWRSFTNNGMIDSWGKSFHEYIRDYTCDCY